ncbi:MAG: Hint domain-containing protein [Pseudomonadota bacterium]
MPTTFTLFSLGVAPEIDTVEGNTTSENDAALNGLVFGSAAAPIAGNVQTMSDDPAGNFTTGGTTSYDVDNNALTETFSIDGGPPQTHDATMIYTNTIITYTDGTSATVTAIVMQDTTGNLYLMPPPSGPNSYSNALEAKPIETVTLGTSAPALGTDVYGLTADRFLLDPADQDGDGVADASDIDSDGDGILNVDEMDAGVFTTTTPRVDVFATGGSSTDVIDLTAFGVSVGDTVTISNVLADGDLNSGPETFTLDFNSGEFVTGNLQTGVQNNGSLIAVTTPVTQTVTVIDIGGGVPGLQVTIDATAQVNALGGNPAVSYTLDITGNGLVDRDTDGDGVADRLDLDSDNDGIYDNIEAQQTASYVPPSGVDTDGDGLDDAYEGSGNVGLTPVDTDSDGTLDVLDLDSDNDGINDVDEAGHGVSQAAIDASPDTDGDGIPDVIDETSGWNPFDGTQFNLADSDGDVAADGSDAVPLIRDFDYRDNIICFTAGTAISTPSGARRIDRLKAGDMVLTLDNGPQRIRWIGQKTVRATGALAPVKFARGTIGNHRDLLVSPQHRMLCGGYMTQLHFGEPEVLAPAKSLVDELGVTIAYGGMVTYVHMLFDAHQIVIANGAPSESFFPGNTGLSSLSDPSRDEIFRLFPDLRSHLGAYGPASRVCVKAADARALVGM